MRTIEYSKVDLPRLDTLSGQLNAEAAARAADVVLKKEIAQEPEPTQFGAAVEDERAAKVCASL